MPTYAAARRIYGRSAGLAAALVLGTSLLYFALARFLILDMAVSVFMGATLFCFILGVREPPPAAGSAGVFGIELFLTRSGDILVNEIAPRPHNSGHFSIEACVSSQFDQYIRLLLGLPLGSPELLRPAMMVNLFGEPGGFGEAEYVGLEEALAVPGVALHLYGKREVRPFRKMGHLTALGATPEEAI